MVHHLVLKAGLLLSMALSVACSSDSGNGAGSGPSAAPVGASSGVALSSSEQSSLAFLREEEKLARDVYAALATHDPMFTNIGASEQTHMDAIGTLLTRYGLADPAAGKAAGAFTNPTLQGLYDALVASGKVSYVAALAVGVEIEELDIHDIDASRVGLSHDDIATTYDNLTRGSRNHLRSFYGKLKAAGGTYSPKHLDAASFEAIVTSETERGR